MNLVLVIALVLVISTIAVGIYAVKSQMDGSRVKTFLGVNVSTFFLLLIGATIVLFSGSSAMAESTAAAATASADGMRYLGAALSTGLAAIGAGIAVAISASAAIGAISENEKLLGKTIIFVGLAEGIAIYGLIISIMLLGQ